MNDVLKFEIVAEPMPSRAHIAAADILHTTFNKFLKKKKISFSEITVFSNFRRIIAEIHNIQFNEYLQDFISDTLNSIKWPDEMRWGAHKMRFIRPILSFSCNIGNKELNVGFGYLISHGIVSTRILSQEQKIIHIQSELNIYSIRNSTYIINLTLLSDLVASTEEPRVIFEKLKTPNLPKIIVSEIFNQQNLILLFENNDNDEYIHYACIIEYHKGKDQIISGINSALKYKLHDALEFINLDLNSSLHAKSEQLKTISFHKELGNMYSKIQRMKDIARYLITWISHTNIQDVMIAIDLSKIDLTTYIVKEFPKLQGKIGAIYAAEEGYNNDIIDALNTQYAHQNLDQLQSPVATTLIFVDRFDSLIGLFCSGTIPTASKDPYGMRRMANVIINLIVLHTIYIPVRLLIQRSIVSYTHIMHECSKDIEDQIFKFLQSRLIFRLTKVDNISHNITSAVLISHQIDNLYLIHKMCIYVHNISNSQKYIDMISTFKRAYNLLSKSSESNATEYKIELFEHSSETSLHKKLIYSITILKRLKKENKFDLMIQELYDLVPHLSCALDSIMIKSDNAQLTHNRQSLLTACCNAFNIVVDLQELLQ